QDHDWYNVHVYNTAVSTSSGDAPNGSIQFKDFGEAGNTNTWDNGEVSFDLAGVTDATWTLIAEACDPTHFLLFRTGHECHANIYPKLTVNVAVPPKQPFSCGAAIREGGGVTTGPPLQPSIVLAVGESCSKSPYGFYAYIWQRPCKNAQMT